MRFSFVHELSSVRFHFKLQKGNKKEFMQCKKKKKQLMTPGCDDEFHD